MQLRLLEGYIWILQMANGLSDLPSPRPSTRLPQAP